MKTFFASVLGGFIALLLFLAVSIFVVIAMIPKAEPPPESIVLEIDLRRPLPDQPANAPPPFGSSSSFIGMLQNLERAAQDPAVHGVFIRASDMGIGHSRAEELRATIQTLRDAGKFVHVHSQGFLGTSPSAYRSISAADEIILQPGSEIVVSGLSTETLFMGNLFEEFEASAEILAFYEYKNAPNVYQQNDYTEPHREAMLELISDIWDVTVRDIAEDRAYTDVTSLRELLESGPITADRALEANLITQINWPEDAERAALQQAGAGAELVSVFKYQPPYVRYEGPAIAIVGGEGAIVTGGYSGSPFGGEGNFASDSIAEAILSAGRNENVGAIVFRVDSGGGSAIASEQIWRAVERVRNDMNKPVVVSMGSVAASGGYYVAAGADAIFASETTITGSIGVYGGKFALAEAMRRFGVNPSTIAVGGPMASIYTLDSFTDEQRELLYAGLERTYDRFMNIVATGRELDESRVREIARGRVWSGTDAADLGLVTNVGGLMDAISYARELANIPEDANSETIFYPEAPTLDEFIASLTGSSASAAANMEDLSVLLQNEQVQMLIQQSQALSSGQTQMRSEYGSIR